MPRATNRPYSALCTKCLVVALAGCSLSVTANVSTKGRRPLVLACDIVMKLSASHRGVRTSEGVDLWPLRAMSLAVEASAADVPDNRPLSQPDRPHPRRPAPASPAVPPSGPPPHARGASTGHRAQPIWTPHPVIQRNLGPVTPDPRRVRRPARHPGVRPLTPQALLDRPRTDRGTLHRMQLRALGCGSLRYGAVHGSTCTRSELRRERA
jgi:hypothetical protein